jgi:hypothetical protein
MPANRVRLIVSSCRSLIVMLMSSILAGACQFTGREAPDNVETADLVQAIVDAECDTRAFFMMARRQDVDTTTLVSANDLLDTEVHDCQRLITGGTLGPRVGLLVSRSRVELNDFTAGVVVAEIINHDGPAYAELGIQQGLNCLWLQGDAVNNPTGMGWIAAIVQPSRSGNCVADAPFQPAPGQQLQLHRLQHGGPLYPSTGRWMWDGGRQFIGIRCGDGWCEMGRPGFTPTDSIPSAQLVPGWFDEQLMSYAPTPGAPLQLSGLLGRISPVPGLSTLPDNAYNGPNGAPVATITFDDGDDAALAVYRTKFGIPGGARTVQVHHRRNSTPNGPIHREFRMGGSTWTPVHHNPHATHAGRGAVRWAWNDADEAVWYPCDLGCCTTDALQ